MVTEEQKKEYGKYIKQITPKHNLGKQMLRAFLMGGLICTLGQMLIDIGMNTLGLSEKHAGSFCSLVLIGVAVFLTGLNIYPSIVKWGGAGALVPITGFANSVAAAAIEYKTEGQVFGVGSKIFTIAGPVILFGIFTSFLIGLIQMVL